MKRFFVLTMLVACLFCNVTASAESLYRGNVSDIIEAFKMVGNEFNFRVWGTEYYTYKGINRCELHFGNSQNNLVRFRLNNDNSVARMLVTTSNSELDSLMQAGMLLGTALNAYGVDSNDFAQAWLTLLQDLEDNAYSNYFHKRYSLWSYKTHQYIIMDIESNMTKADYYFYPE